MFFLTRTLVAMRSSAFERHLACEDATGHVTEKRNARWRKNHHDVCEHVMPDGGARAADARGASGTMCALLRSIAVTRKGVAHGIGDCLFTRSSAVTTKPQLP
ncbi:hypothetical protein [Xanthomonas arboricola]|uniref:hypothetical protein n=1 Tax=Xanthomonas arboricola TaxID=56448 RepID=UPI001C85C54C|nr:hypothetical protein [Xanthomonas arboricola]